jgi:predicted acetyltransferase
MKLPNDPADFEAGDGTLLESNAPRSGARTEAIDDSPVLGGATDQTALVVNELTKRFGERTAFSDVSFQVAYGEVFGFLGPNGAGKTTAWLTRLQSDQAKTIDVGTHCCIYRWIVESDRVLGGIALRHGHDDYVLWAGHIGYGIRPSARRRGLATWALGRMLDEARVLGLDRVLAVCAVDNVASVKTIERGGGVFEGVRDTKFGPVRRYWIDL